MKIKKKATLSAMLVAITSLALFIAMFFAVLFFFRGCDGRYFPDSLDEIESAINRVKATPHTIETIEVFLGPESMMIIYAPEAQNVITRYEAPEVGEIKKSPAITQFSFDIGANYIFPREDGTIEGTLQNLDAPNFLGYVKRRPAECPTNALCICDCANFRLTTQESIFSTQNAFIECEREKCTSVSDVTMDQTIYLKDFIKYNSNYEEADEPSYRRMYPQPHTIHWEGGFIMPRTSRERFELGEITQSVCRSTGIYRYFTRECPVGNTEIFIQKRMIAGHLQNYMADFFNLRIINVGPNKIAFEVT